MAQARIRIDQAGHPTSPIGVPGASRDDLILGLQVALRNQDDTGVRSWRWSLKDRPTTSLATLSNTTAAVPTFTPDVPGTYRVELIVNEGRKGEKDIQFAAVRNAQGLRMPAAGEQAEAGPRGYMPDLEEWLETGASGASINDWKASVRASSTGPVDLSTDLEDGDSFGGVTLATGDSILLRDQADASENGIFTVRPSGAPTRRGDAINGLLSNGAVVWVEEGTNAGTTWVLTTTDPIDVGTDPQTWSPFGVGAAAANASYLTLGAHASLVNERVFTPGTGLSEVDGGAGNPYTLSVDPSGVDHGGLAGLADDDHTQYHNDARGDARYYQQSEFINTSVGGADAGKPIVLDGSGHIDASMLNDADVDHGSLGGLADDDHTQYHTDARGDARYFQQSEFLSASVGAGSAGAPIVLDAGGHIDASMLNDADVDHGALGGLGDDDHPQYLLVSGTRAMAGDLDMGGNAVTNVGLVDGVTVSAHAARHILGGADEIDGDRLDIDWNPSNYTPTVAPAEVTDLDHLTAHLAGIDAALGGFTADHGGLGGLGDDDHPQYLLEGASRSNNTEDAGSLASRLRNVFVATMLAVGTAGALPAGVDAPYDDVVIHGSGSRGISIVSANNSNSGIALGDDDDPNICEIFHQNADNSLHFRINTVDELTLEGSSLRPTTNGSLASGTSLQHWSQLHTDVATVYGPLTISASGTSALLSFTTTEGGGLQLRAQSTDANPDWRLNVNSGEEFFIAVGGGEKWRLDDTTVTQTTNLFINASSPILTVGSGVGSPIVAIDKAEGSSAWFEWFNAGTRRWLAWMHEGDENLTVRRYNGSGVLQDTPITVHQVNGNVTLTPDGSQVSMGGPLVFTNSGTASGTSITHNVFIGSDRADDLTNKFYTIRGLPYDLSEGNWLGVTLFSQIGGNRLIFGSGSSDAPTSIEFNTATALDTAGTFRGSMDSSGIFRWLGNIDQDSVNPQHILGDGTGNPQRVMDKSDASTAYDRWNVAGVTRWLGWYHETNENLMVYRYDSGGSLVDAPITIAQANGAITYSGNGIWSSANANLEVGNGAGSTGVRLLKSDAGTTNLLFRTGSFDRQIIRMDGSENLLFLALDNAGALVATTTYSNATGGWTFPGNIALPAASPVATLGNGTGSTSIVNDKGDGASSLIGWYNMSVLRWLGWYHNTAEDLSVRRYDSGGVFQDAPLSIANASGTITFSADIVMDDPSGVITMGTATGSPRIDVFKSPTGSFSFRMLRGLAVGAGDRRFVHDTDEGLDIDQHTGAAWENIARFVPAGEGLATGSLQLLKALYMPTASPINRMGDGSGSPLVQLDKDGTGTSEIEFLVDSVAGSGAAKIVHTSAETLVVQGHDGGGYQSMLTFSGPTQIIQLSAGFEPISDGGASIGDDSFRFQNGFFQGMAFDVTSGTSLTSDHTHFYRVDNSAADRVFTFNQGEPVGRRYEILVLSDAFDVEFAREGPTGDTINGEPAITKLATDVEGLYIAVKDTSTTWKLYGPIVLSFDTAS